MQSASITDCPPKSRIGGHEPCDGEQFVAHLYLSILSGHLQDIERATAHLATAYDIVRRLSDRVRTFRGSSLVKVISIRTTVDDLSETIRLPTVGGRLVVPAVDLETMAKSAQRARCGTTHINLQRIDISYHRIRLRTDRLRIDLTSVLEAAPATLPEAMVEQMLGDCLQIAALASDTLDIAHDYLSLAADFARLGNPAMAGMAVENSKNLLRHRELSDAMKHRLLVLTKALQSTGS